MKAFAGVGAEKIVVPSGATTIGTRAFAFLLHSTRIYLEPSREHCSRFFLEKLLLFCFFILLYV